MGIGVCCVFTAEAIDGFLLSPLVSVLLLLTCLYPLFPLLSSSVLSSFGTSQQTSGAVLFVSLTVLHHRADGPHTRIRDPLCTRRDANVAVISVS